MKILQGYQRALNSKLHRGHLCKKYKKLANIWQPILNALRISTTKIEKTSEVIAGQNLKKSRHNLSRGFSFYC